MPTATALGQRSGNPVADFAARRDPPTPFPFRLLPPSSYQAALAAG
jgi:hypothetical protein